MGEIKYRFWETNVKEMIYDIHAETSIGPLKVIPHKNFKIMRWTGLVDKNGKEIYEDDILEAKTLFDMENYYIHITTDEKPPHNFIRGLIKKPGADVKGISNGIYTELCSSVVMADTNKWIFVEVIGNIYENPDLLE